MFFIIFNHYLIYWIVRYLFNNDFNSIEIHSILEHRLDFMFKMIHLIYELVEVILQLFMIFTLLGKDSFFYLIYSQIGN